jgi:hypothetical protein
MTVSVFSPKNTSNIERYKADLEKLISTGEILFNTIQYECYPEEVKKKIVEATKSAKKADEIIKTLPVFKTNYQTWYSEALAIIKLILPDRLNDFIKFYEKPKVRKSVEYGNYVIEDYLQSLRVTSYNEIKVGPQAAIPQFEQQLNILKSVRQKFESSLFDLKQLVQADLFDSEIDSAKELIKHKFFRAAGVVGGVILEKHLHQVCVNHNLSLSKKNPTINDFNELLKQNNVIDVPQWRFIQHLGDIRNICGHNKEEPTSAQVIDLIDGVAKIVKTLF